MKRRPMARFGRLVFAPLLVLLAACHGPPGAVRALPAAVAAKRPTIARVQGNLWLVGLPERHGWARERRVLLTKRDAEHGIDVKVGVVAVLDDGYATAAPVGIVYEEPGA